MDKIEKFLNIALVFFIALLVLVFIGAFKSNRAMAEAKDEACKELGYKKYIPLDIYNYVLGFCEDNNGDLHYVMYEYNKDCCFCLTTDSLDMSMKEISVGDVRVLK